MSLRRKSQWFEFDFIIGGIPPMMALLNNRVLE